MYLLILKKGLERKTPPLKPFRKKFLLYQEELFHSSSLNALLVSFIEIHISAIN